MFRKVAVVAVVAVVWAGAAHAQVSRVFVSVNGNDANVCSNIATPCRTLGAGITQVDPEGEVIVIDSGSYAGVTITKSVKVHVAPGVVAFSGLPIVVGAGSGTVVLRGLTLKAATFATGTAISHQSGVLFLENMIVDGWSTGLSSGGNAEELLIKGSVFRNQFNHAVVAQLTFSANPHLAIDASYFEENGYGIQVLAGNARISNSSFTRNYGAAIEARNSVTDVTVQGCEISANGLGLFVQSAAYLRFSHSTVYRNGLGLSNSSATLQSYGNNVIAANSISGTVTPLLLQ